MYALAGPAARPGIARCGWFNDSYSATTCSLSAGRPLSRSSIVNMAASPGGERELLREVVRVGGAALELHDRVVDEHVVSAHGALADDHAEDVLLREALARAARLFLGDEHQRVLAG